ncbi:type II toxin-antitoxin system VapB family antitoxin [Mycobacterium hubeiense]|uniref:type II toxin-antitoxin system VapB family antitoxin n=1 Tax=Mycobacterium hubeiense TaxID=1867256 RepID=UPI000C7F0580|nr:type II toxin-antitoxin system VapB family antitoxin [Mycobacterium sp. QGD 101]
MRTTVNIDDSLLAEAKVVAARTSRSLGSVMEDALRAMLRRDAEERGRGEFRLPTHGSGGLQPGVDLEDKEALAELLGDNAGP